MYKTPQLSSFKDAESQCMQYSVSLYCEEQVKFDQKIKPKVTIKQSFQEFSFGYDEVRKADIHTDILCNLVLDIRNLVSFFRPTSLCQFLCTGHLVLKMTIVPCLGCCVLNLLFLLLAQNLLPGDYIKNS